MANRLSDIPRQLGARRGHVRRAVQELKRKEAEARNAVTPYERRAQYLRGAAGRKAAGMMVLSESKRWATGSHQRRQVRKAHTKARPEV